MATEMITQLRQNSAGSTEVLRDKNNIGVVKTTSAESVDERQKLQSQDKEKSSTASPLIGQEQLDMTVQELSTIVEGFNRELNFSVDDKSGKTIIKVIDSETDEVIRQIPSEEVVEMAQMIDQHAGLLMDAKV